MAEASGTGPAVEIDVLGPFRVAVDGRPVTIPAGRLRVLLAVLAMAAGTPVTTDRLADALWGEDLPQDVRRSLQTYIARLRGVVGSDTLAGERGSYLLRASADDVDALRFVRLLDRAGGDEPAERAALVEALRLWRGEPFDGLESSWLRETEAVRLSERRLSALERRIDLDLAGGRSSEVVAELRELAASHPLREPLWARLLRALASSGRQSEALEQYEVIRARIAEDLGVDPGGELRDMHARLLDGDVSEPAAPEAPSSPAETVVPRQLPVDIATFTGRRGALDALDALLDGDEPGRVRIGAVHGAGGVGKTSLVVHWAHREAERFPDGQLYLNLRGYGPGAPVEPAAALDVLLRGLGVAGERIPGDEPSRSGLLRSILAGRRMLVVLDNAHDADQVRPLLPGAGRSLVVVTSRSQLRGLVAREGARRIGLDGLARSESIRLLSGAFDATEIGYDETGLSELAELCEHLPLALAIAAERASRHPETGLGDLLDELRTERDRLDVLDVGDESTSLRAVFESSYRALDVESARVFRLLGVHPDPDFGVPAAAALTALSAPSVRRLLDRLVDTSLLQQRRAARYELHDLMRA